MTTTCRAPNLIRYRRFHLICTGMLMLLAIRARAAQSSVKQALADTTESGERPLQLEYHLQITRPTMHLANVEIDTRNASSPTLDFIMPVWSPGRYAIYDFAKNVQEFEASSADGRTLVWSQPDKQTWRVQTGGASGIQVRYQVFGNDLNGSFSQIDSTHVNLNGASIYMYVAGHKPDPIALTIDAPAGWKTVSGYSLDTDKPNFQVPNYDRLIDTPLEISPAITINQFPDHGKIFIVAIHDYGTDPGARPELIRKLSAGVKKIVGV